VIIECVRSNGVEVGFGSGMICDGVVREVVSREGVVHLRRQSECSEYCWEICGDHNLDSQMLMELG